jgi:hypothetical protein
MADIYPVPPFRAGLVPGVPFPGQNSRGRLELDEAVRAGEATRLCDISEWQPDINDATYLAWSKSMIFRVLYGALHVDAAWHGGARRKDLHAGGATFVGLYHYLLGDQGGAAQAQAFHKLVGPIQRGEVFIADFETGSKANLTAWFNEMLALYGPGIAPYLWVYTGLSFGGAAGALPVQWIAAYQSAEPSTPHELWQFSQSYPVPGVGTADCSLFHGSGAQLAAHAYGGGVAPGSWTFPAPADFKVSKQTREGYALSWRKVRGPKGQVPESYSVYTYRGARVVSHQVVKALAASEYGPGGTGLPAGTYLTRVWANGAPSAPPGSPVTVKLAA